ncbi:MAG TPA: hypothetical protein VF593_13795 [Chthoniobacteraceae bacterium]|jgi:ATP-dependent protease HslVU (ClpYQ) peptidase subunit
MSTLVVVRKGSRAVIAADSLFSEGSLKIASKYRVNSAKIHHFRGAFIGFTGWSVFHNIFESVMERCPADLDFRSRRHIFETFHKLHKTLKEEFHLETGEQDDQPVQSSQWNCLIAAPSGLFEVQSDREVVEYSSFWANGSGTRFALGAMHAVYKQVEDPEVIARLGVEAACEFDAGSAGPIVSHAFDLQP